MPIVVTIAHPITTLTCLSAIVASIVTIIGDYHIISAALGCAYYALDGRCFIIVRHVISPPLGVVVA